MLTRRDLLQLAPLAAGVRPAATATTTTTTRTRPGDPAWPSEAEWDRLNQATNGRLTKLRSPLSACHDDPAGTACRDLFRTLKNPYAIGDEPVLTQTTGWVDAWTAQPSAYVVAAETTGDVVAAVNFARDHNLRLVVRGGGHSYLGTSTAPDSLLIWTRRMNAIAVIEAFVPAGCDIAPQQAVTVGAGAIWMHVYNAVTTNAGRYVQGGGCGTVGVAGLIQGGGFGSYSKAYGTAGASLLEAEIVTADGAVRTVNACSNSDLFWALKGGGGGSFGVVTRLTLRTHALPEVVGVVLATVQAVSDVAFRRLTGRFVSHFADHLVSPHWGEIATLRPGNRLVIAIEFQGLDRAQAEAIWQPFFDWVADAADDFDLEQSPRVRSIPARSRWDPAFFREHAPAAALFDNRPGASPDDMFWSANLSEAGHFIHGFQSAWLPAGLLQPDRRDQFADALCSAARLWPVELHFQKGLAGAPPEALAAAADTPMNPAVLTSFSLAIIAGEGPPAFPGLPGHAPDLPIARRHATRIAQAMAELTKVVPDAGAYVAESGFFQPNWQNAYWGPHYPRLLGIKRKYDPDGLFFARHGVGSEDWTEDGMTRSSTL